MWPGLSQLNPACWILVQPPQLMYLTLVIKAASTTLTVISWQVWNLGAIGIKFSYQPTLCGQLLQPMDGGRQWCHYHFTTCLRCCLERFNNPHKVKYQDLLFFIVCNCLQPSLWVLTWSPNATQCIYEWRVTLEGDTCFQGSGCT